MISRRSTHNFDDESTVTIAGGLPKMDDMSLSDEKSVSMVAPWSTDPRLASLGAPENFGQVAEGIYRSSYPQEANLGFLKTLGLKTVVTLVDSECPPKFQAFMRQEGINHIIIDMKGTKKVAISQDVITQVLRVALDQSQYPVMIHCNHGKHRTGCSVAIYRKLRGWSVENIIAEYKAYAGEKVRQQDIDYITNFDVKDVVSPLAHPGLILGEPFLASHMTSGRPYTHQDLLGTRSLISRSRLPSRSGIRVTMATLLWMVVLMTYVSIMEVISGQDRL